jgi:hypothetical protein
LLTRPSLGSSSLGDRSATAEGAPAVAAFSRRPYPDRAQRARPAAGVRWNRDAAPAGPCPPAWWVGRSLATRPRAVTPGERPEDPSARGDRHPARLGIRQGPQLQLLAQARRPLSVHPPQTCDWRCRACRIYGRPFYSRGDLQYLEHGTGPLAAELDRLWRVRGVGKRRTVREGAGNADGRRALPRGAAGLTPRRPHSLAVTDLYYPGLQDPPSTA